MEIVFTEEFNSAFKNAFGIQKANIPQAPARIEQSSQGQPYYATDALGREFFLPIRLQVPPFFDYLIPFAIMSVNCKKTIVSTPMPQRGGAVKELISIDDYVFNIKGLLINNVNAYPEADIIALHSIFKVNGSVAMRSVLSDIFLSGDFNHMVTIKELKWPAIAAVEHAKPFEIDCESDMIFTLEVK